MPRLIFFVGKGGVGKTTISAAYAIHTALQNSANRVLLVSTDPAHSLGDVLKKKLGGSPKPIEINPHRRLWASEFNASALFRSFLGEHKQSIVQIVENGSLFTAGEISPLLDTALPGMSEMAALLAVRDAANSAKYSHVVVDTAPFGHTLRLFRMPEQFARILKFLRLAAGRDRVLSEHFGGGRSHEGPEFIEQWRENLEQLTHIFSVSDLFLVTTAEKFALNESLRCLQELSSSSIHSFKLQAVVLNRAALRAGKCVSCRKKVAASREAKTFLRSQFPAAELYVAEDPGFAFVGVHALRRLGDHAFARKQLGLKAPPGRGNNRNLKMIKAHWPKLSSLTFVLGKGGVGKTTISAALGFHQRRISNDPVEICSVDPAPSLDDIFLMSIGDTPTVILGDKKFRASELDAAALFSRWVTEIREEVNSATSGDYSGVHIDLSFERQLVSALLDIVPPGLDEVLAIFRISELCGSSPAKIIIDMAPTGHALELLRTPDRIVSWSRVLLKSLAAHRKLALAQNVAVRIAELEVRARALSTALRNSGEASIFAVMLPEPLPDRETQRLFSELKRLQLKPAALFVNRILFVEDTANCRRCRNAREGQLSLLANLKKRSLAAQIFVVRDFQREIAGASELRAITDELWRLN